MSMIEKDCIVYECSICGLRIAIDKDEEPPKKCIICEPIQPTDVDELKPFIL